MPPSTAKYSRALVCGWKNSGPNTAYPWLISYSSPENLRRKPHDGSIHATGGWIGRELSVVGDGHQPCCDLTVVCQYPQPAHRDGPDRPVWGPRSSMASGEPDRQRT